MNIRGNQTVDNHTIFFAIFFTQLSAIVAQGSLRSSFFELLIQVVIWGILLGFSLAFAWSYIDKDKASSKLSVQLSNGAAMIGMMAFLFQIMTGSITSGILLMLSWLLVALSFSFKTQRNLYFALLASMTLLLYAASISKSSSFILYIVIYTLAAIIALAGNFYLSKMKQQISQSNSTKSFPFKLPITIIASLILLITAGIYLLVPRPHAMNWGVFPAGGGRYQAEESWPENSEKDGEGGTELGNAFDKAMDELKKSGMDTKALEEQLKQSGVKDKLNEFEEKANQAQKQMKQDRDANSFNYSGFEKTIELNEKQTDASNYNQLIFFMEGKEPQYLRGKVYDYFDGLSWKTTHQTKQRIERKNEKFTINASLKEPFDLYTVTMATNLGGEATIFTPAATAEVQFPGNAIAKDNYGALFAPRQLSKDTFYSMKIKNEGSRIDGRPVESSAVPSNAELKRYTQLPDDLSERFYQFSKEISAGSSNDLERASKIEQHLKTNYQYSLESVFSSQGKIPVEEFLFERQEGHCEYFATAMVTLMRAQRVPARLVTGFSVTTFNPVTGYYEARGLDAHAWAEVWIPKAGWVTFEATPPYALPRPSEAKNTSQSIEEYLKERSEDAQLTEPDSLKTSLIHTAKRAFETFNELLHKTWAGIKAAISWTGNMFLHYGWLALLIGAVVFVAVHYLRYYLAHSRVRNRLKSAQKDALSEQLKTGYAEMEKIFALYKHPRNKGWTIHQYKVHLEQSFPALSVQVKQISNTLNKSLYKENYNDAPSSKQISEAIQQITAIANHKFEIPIPAEKQIGALKKFIATFSSKGQKSTT